MAAPRRCGHPPQHRAAGLRPALLGAPNISAKSKSTYQPSPFGTGQHLWVNKPDTKFNDAGVFKAPILLTGAKAQKFKEEVDAQAQAFFDEITADMTPGERKKWSVYYPYEELEDDQGEKTGAIVFHFKQNATIKLRDGTTKTVKIGIQDSAGKDMHKPLFFGTELRTMFAYRAIKMVSTKQAGARLDFSMVQVIKLGTGSGGKGFGAVEGGYVDEGDDEGEEQTSGSGNAAAVDGDY